MYNKTVVVLKSVIVPLPLVLLFLILIFHDELMTKTFFMYMQLTVYCYDP